MEPKMSYKLAISSAISVFLMASYVLLGGDARQVDLGSQRDLLPSIEAPSILPQASALLLRR
jgi:hypothetical protein